MQVFQGLTCATKLQLPSLATGASFSDPKQYIFVH